MSVSGVFRRICVVILALVLGPAAGLAQTSESVIPERRINLFVNTDFFGSDLKNIFEVPLAQCEAQCLSDQSCKAFTYNAQASACFLKTAAGAQSDYEGATSAIVIDADAALLKRAKDRAEKLSFLRPEYLASARKVAANNGQYYPTNGWLAEQLVEVARRREAEGNLMRAIELHLAALNDVDGPDNWIEVARLANAAKGNSNQQRSFLREIGPAAALNGYLRANEPSTQANALLELAKALETQNQGRVTIPVLRLASDLSPRREIDTALERALSLFGFRITNNRVDQNALQPRVCAEFSEDLVKAGVNYDDFVKTDSVGLTTEVSGRQLCVEGMRHGENLRLTFRKGLPAENGESLIKSVELNVYVPDRDPTARFAGRSYILPKQENASIPLVTVNLDRVDLTIYRIGDRNLIRSIQEGLFARQVSRWDLPRLSGEVGTKVWSGDVKVEVNLNREVTTALPVGQAIKDFEPGVYAMTARDPNAERNSSVSTQWFVVTDLGISSLVGNDGLHVFVRALGSAKMMPGVKVQVLADNNDILGEATTDADGYAHFAPGLVRGKSGNAPALITVSAPDGDFAFLDQSAAEFDLSDRGVEGRSAPPPIDAFLATDRGAYRPGETINTTVMARDNQAAAIRNLPLTLDLLRPDGVRFARRLVSDSGAGGGTVSIALPGNAKRGTWKLRVYGDTKSAPLLERRVLVEDFVPERIDFDLAMDQSGIRQTDAPVVSIAARYLYGAPGADLAVEGEVKLSALRELAGFKGYRFGSADTLYPPRYASLETSARTGPDGSLDLAVTIPEAGDVNKPLGIEAYIRLRDGSGRPVERRISAPLQPAGPMIGIRPLFTDQVEEGGMATFDVIAVGPQNTQIALPKVGWVVNRIWTTYQWYESYGNWSYEPITRRERIESGEVTLTADGAARISTRVDYGRYEVKLATQQQPYTASSLMFSAGWYVTSDAGDTPDKLQVALDHDVYKVGDVAKLRIDARFDGVARISVLSDRLIETRSVDITRGANEINLTVTEAWGAGAYVTAVAIRPMDIAAGRNPSRALGLVHARIDPGAKKLVSRFVNANEASPRGMMTAQLQVDGIAPGQAVYATISAVDVGVLNITGFLTPSPDDHYFGQRKLGVGLRDVYGKLIDGMQGNTGRLRSGGDSQADTRLNSPPPAEDVLAQFSGIVKADENGLITATFDLPDFNGTLRLMAVVWSDSGVGHAEQDVLVRDPVVLTAYAPRFLAPGDETVVTVELAHAFGPTGTFEFAVSAGSGLEVAPVQAMVDLTDKQRKSFAIPVRATSAGEPSFNVWLKTPDGKVLSKTIRIPVEYNDPEIARQTRLELAANGQWRIDENVLAGLHAGTARATLAVGPLALFDAPGLLSALDRYPYGCTEQITSKAMPLLYFEQLSSALGLGAPDKVRQRVDQAITGVLSNQASNGAFGLWRPNSGDMWLDAYVTDFLSRARARGFDVPDLAFERALNNLRNQINYAPDFEQGGEDVAYALMVLAREGQAAIGDLRYYVDTRAQAFATPLAQAQMGAALASYGDQSRADRMFRLASQKLATPETSTGWRSDYGTHLRDAAAVLTLAVDSGSRVVDQPALIRQVTGGRVNARSTQENLWSLMAVNALSRDGENQKILLNGSPMTGPLVRSLSEQQVQDGLTLRNASAKNATTVLTVFGIPSEPEAAGGNGYRIERSYYTLEGEPADLSNVALNTRLAVVLRVVPLRQDEARLMVNDPLPAGFEIDNPNLIRGGDIAALDWLDLNASARNTEFRSDRFLAAVDWSGGDPFQLAYIVRAVSPGRFHHPAASVEDMYRPAFRARTDAGQVEIAVK